LILGILVIISVAIIFILFSILFNFTYKILWKN
jgi:hypothetical protein